MTATRQDMPPDTAPPARSRSSRFGLLSIVRASLSRRRTRAILTITALTIASTLFTALLNLYGSVRGNLSHEFLGYGPNVIITPAASARSLSPEDVRAAGNALGQSTPSAAVLYAAGNIARDANTEMTAAILAGADLSQLAALNPAWKFSGPVTSARNDNDAWIGTNVARLLQVGIGSTLIVQYQSRARGFHIAGTIQSGGSEDSQVFLSLPAAQDLTGIHGVTTIEAHVSGSEAAIDAVISRLRNALPGATVDAVRPIAESEGRVLLSTRNLLIATTVLILVTIGLCVSAALASIALERRRDFGIMKTLGGSDASVFTAFVLEALLLGGIAAVLGFVIGSFIAFEFAKALFNVSIEPRLSVLGLTAAVTIAVAALAALSPWPIVHRVTPATILRGE